MYDYMKALQERFDKKPPERLVRAVQSAREEVREGMDDEKRKKLLRLLDAQNILLEEATLMSFTAGFKLAWGIAEELGAPYSYDNRHNAFYSFDNKGRTCRLLGFCAGRKTFG